MAKAKTIQDADALLLYRVGPVYCCSPTMPVVSVQLPPRLSHPPGSNLSQPGVFKFPGGIVRVIDLRQQFGVDESDRLEPGRIIVVEVEGGLAGFWVDEILDVIHFPQTGWGKVPALVPRSVFTRTLLFNDQIQLYADFEKLNQFQETGYLRQHIEALKSKAVEAHSRESRSRSSDDNTPGPESPPFKTPGPENDVKIPAGSHTYSSRPDAGPNINHPDKPSRSSSAQSVGIRSDAPPSAGHKPSSRSRKPVAETATVPPKSPMSLKPDVGKSARKTSKPVIASSGPALGEGQKYPQPASPMSLADVQTPKYQPAQHPIAGSGSQPSLEDRSGVDRSLWWLVAMLLVVSTGVFFSGDVFRQVDRQPASIQAPPERATLNPGRDPVTQQRMPVEKTPTDAEAVSELPGKTAVAGGPVLSSDAGAALRVDHEEPGQLSGLDQQEAVSPSALTDLQASTVRSGKSDQADGEAIVQDEPQYHASIGQDEEGIVIILNAPDTEFLSDRDPSLQLDKQALETVMEFTAISESTGERAPADTANQEAAAEADDTGRSTIDGAKHQLAHEEVKITQKPGAAKTLLHDEDSQRRVDTPESASKTVIHVVVKGDTLWHIARRYINNPYRYPELARLSKIKNPDLIYPGDRVKIIINQKAR